jgi:hypothetical protein
MCSYIKYVREKKKEKQAKKMKNSLENKIEENNLCRVA